MTIRQQINNFLKEGDTEAAIRFLQENIWEYKDEFTSKELKEFLKVHASYQTLKQQETGGEISFQDRTLERNKINARIIEIF